MTDKRARQPLGHRRPRAAAHAGLPGAPTEVHERLRQAGIDPDRLSIHLLGLPRALLGYRIAPWARRLAVGGVLWAFLYYLQSGAVEPPSWVLAAVSLVAGLIILQAACQVLVLATERFAARMQWSHYVAGSVAEMLATLPECVVIVFVVMVSPQTALTLALITVYSNSLVFSIYSYFLPRDHSGKFLMPKPVTDAGMQLLIAGGAIGLVIGLTMLVFSTGTHPKQAFGTLDFFVLGLLLLLIFGVYLHKLVQDLASEEEDVHEALELTDAERAHRRTLVYQNISSTSLPGIALLFVIGLLGAILGGDSVGRFAEIAIGDLNISGIMAALILAVFAGMSEYVILYTSHRKGNYGIALANAFGGITQLIFLILPFTFCSIAIYQTFVNPQHPELPIPFSVPNILLLLFLFPTLHTLAALLENDHTMGVLDTTIMIGIVATLILLLVGYG